MYKLINNDSLRLLDGFFGNFPLETKQFVSIKNPKVNITEKEDQYLLDVFYPGVKRENFEVKIDEGILIIKSVFKEGDWEKNNNVFHKEYTMYDFERTFKLSKDIKDDKVSAKYNYGVLEISIPRDLAKAKKKIVKIE